MRSGHLISVGDVADQSEGSVARVGGFPRGLVDEGDGVDGWLFAAMGCCKAFALASSMWRCRPR
ncbi:hypothetical protein SUDANB15_07254 [Streptomyces sp. enrichment culture]